MFHKIIFSAGILIFGLQTNLLASCVSKDFFLAGNSNVIAVIK